MNTTEGQEALLHALGYIGAMLFILTAAACFIGAEISFKVRGASSARFGVIFWAAVAVTVLHSCSTLT